MPTGVRLTTQQLQAIKAALDAGKSRTEAEEATGLSATAITRVKLAIEKGTFDAMVAARAAGKPVARANPHASRAIVRATPLTTPALPIVRRGRTTPRPTLEERARTFSTRGRATHAVVKVKPHATAHDPTRREKIVKWKAKGWGVKDIASKLGITNATVYYYLGKKNGQHATQQKHTSTMRESGNGNGSNPFTKEICIGIAYSETERTIALLGQRLGLSPEVLRRRLPELLGYTPLRA